MLTVVTAGAATPFVAGVMAGTVAGATIGGATAAALGGNIGQGLLTGAISGAIFGGIGGAGLSGGWLTAAHAVGGAASGAINGAITGGDIGMNALIGGLSAGVTQWAGANTKHFEMTGNYIKDVVKRAALGGLIGGTTSAALGGNFLSGLQTGAVTSAISFTANCFMHEVLLPAARMVVAGASYIPGPIGVGARVVRTGIAVLSVGTEIIYAKGNNSDANETYRDAVRDAGLNKKQAQRFKQLFHFDKDHEGRGGDDNYGYWDIRKAAEDFLSKQGK